MSEGGESAKVTYGHLCLTEENRLRSPMSEGGESTKVTYV